MNTRQRTRRYWRAPASAGAALALMASTAISAPLVKDCGKDGKYIIGFSQANNAEPYRQHVNDDLTAAAKAVPQFTLQIADGAGNVNTQTSQVDNFITQKVDMILISPFEASPLTPVVARAIKAGIPVIELDRKTVGDPGKDYTAFIGGDNYKIALEAGNYTADTLLPGVARQPSWKACRARRRRSSVSTASRTASRRTTRSRSSRNRPPTGSRIKLRRPFPRCCRRIPTSRSSTPATT